MKETITLPVKAILEVREQIQEDLLCFFDGMPDEVQRQFCDIVVRNINKLLDKKAIKP